MPLTNTKYLLNEVALRNKFIVAPEKTINLLIDAIIHETTDEHARTMLRILNNSRYIETILELYRVSGPCLKDAILQLVGNMLASEDPTIKLDGCYFVECACADVFGELACEKSAGNAAYVIYNYVDAKLKTGDVPEIYLNHLAAAFGPEFLTKYHRSAWKDLLWAGMKVNEKYDGIYSVDFVLELLSHDEVGSEVMGVLVRMLGDKSRDDLEHYAEIAYNKLCRDVLCYEQFASKKYIMEEALFALSNIVVEEEIADMFVEDDETYDRVLSLLGSGSKNALWVMMNAAKKATVCPEKLRALLESEFYRQSGSLQETLKSLIFDLRSRTACGTPAASTAPSPAPTPAARPESDNALVLDIAELRRAVAELKAWQERVDWRMGWV